MTVATGTLPKDSGPDAAWVELNQRYLKAALTIVVEDLVAFRDTLPERSPAQLAAAEDLARLERQLPRPAALQLVGERFGLSPFERAILLLCAGFELDSRFRTSVAAAAEDPRTAYPSFGLALMALPKAHWSALAPESPLRRWRLIELEGSEPLIARALRIDERVLHFLTGLSGLDERLAPLLQPLPAPPALPDSQQAVVDQIVAAMAPGAERASVLIQLYGSDEEAQHAVAAAVGQALAVQTYVLQELDIPSQVAEREQLVLLWQREGLLAARALLLCCQNSERGEPALALLRRLPGLVMVASTEPVALPRQPLLRVEVQRPSAEEQRGLWRQTLGGHAPPEAVLQLLSAHFQLSSTEIAAVGAITHAAVAKAPESGAAATQLGATLWDSCRLRARTRLDDLARRIEPVAAWEDLILPAGQLDLLHQLAAQVRQRGQVYEQWGFAEKGLRGLGISALFAGTSGTGKTLAAEVLATELRLDLYHIDLSQVVSKYIGETEKNLRRVFDAAEAGGAILLFDEADALFGKRSEVKDSHDRHANIEVSYLLQRMEAYRGLAILTTNMKAALDPAFLRRLRFILQFPFPEAEQRQLIWSRVFPASTPTQGLNFQHLARLNVPGGHIRNIALHAAFLAAAAGEPVRMQHLLGAARCEYAKLEKPLTSSEIGGWV